MKNIFKTTAKRFHTFYEVIENYYEFKDEAYKGLCVLILEKIHNIRESYNDYIDDCTCSNDNFCTCKTCKDHINDVIQLIKLGKFEEAVDSTNEFLAPFIEHDFYVIELTIISFENKIKQSIDDQLISKKDIEILNHSNK